MLQISPLASFSAIAKWKSAPIRLVLAHALEHLCLPEHSPGCIYLPQLNHFNHHLNTAAPCDPSPRWHAFMHIIHFARTYAERMSIWNRKGAASYLLIQVFHLGCWQLQLRHLVCWGTDGACGSRSECSMMHDAALTACDCVMSER